MRVLAGAGAALVLMLAGPTARSEVTSPRAGDTVRGDVAIVEDEGGTRPFYCSSSGVDSTITVTRAADGTIAHAASKGGPGSWTTTWVTHGRPAGDYRVMSTATHRDFLCQPALETLSDFTVRLENRSAVAYTGDTSATVAGLFTASAALTDATTGRAIEARTIVFTLDGLPAATCVTGADGKCSSPALALALPGDHTIAAGFDGDCCWLGSGAEKTFTVTLPA